MSGSEKYELAKRGINEDAEPISQFGTAQFDNLNQLSRQFRIGPYPGHDVVEFD